MADQDRSTDKPVGPDDADDTEGQAFTWSVVDDQTKGRRLRQSWTPDEPKDVKARKPEQGKGTSER